MKMRNQNQNVLVWRCNHRMKAVLLLSMLMAGMVSATAQTTFTKWKLVQDPSTLTTDDVVVIVDLTTSSAMRNNPEYEEGNTVSKSSPPAMKVTLKEEQDRIVSEFGDTVVWTAVHADGKYQFRFLNEENRTRYLFDSDQNLRVGFVSDDNESKRKFDIDRGLLHRRIQTDENVYKEYHVGVKAASGIMAMMGGSTWELMADGEDGSIGSDIAATKMAFFKKVETSLPDPTLHFPLHDYEADVRHAGDFESPVATVDEDANAPISYWSGNTELAEVDAATGAVTVKKRGTVRIYAQVAETANYDNYLTSYVLRIDDSEAAGGRSHPFTVAEAIAYAKEDHAEETANGVCYFVKGIVSSVGGAMAGMEGMEDMMEMMSGMMEGMEGMEGFDMSAMLSMFMGEQETGTVTYAISDNGVARDELPVNNGRGLQVADMTEDDISVGDEVTVFGPLAFSEDNDMMSMFGGGTQGGSEGGNDEDKRTVKMTRVNYLQEHERNLITQDVVLYYEQTKHTDQLFSITKMFGGTLVTNTNAQDNTLAKTSLKLSDTDIASWVVDETKTDSLLTPWKTGIVKVTVNAPVLLQPGDTIKMKRRFNLEVRDRQLPPAGTMVGNYELVTSASQLQPNDKLLIVATIEDKPKVLVKSSGSGGGMMDMFGGGSNAGNITIGDDGMITEVPDDALILTLEQADDKWLLQTGRTSEYKTTYLYVSDPAEGGSTSMIPGMGGSGAKLKTGTREAVGDSCQVSFTFLPEKNDSVKIQFNFPDRGDTDNPVTAKNVIRYEKGTMSASFGGFEPESDKATLPRLYRLVQADQYSITVSDALWATIVSSYDVTLPEGLTGYVVHEIDYVNNQAVLHDVTEQGGLQGGKPYLLKATEAGTYMLTKATDAIAEPDVNLLQVSDSETGNGVYVLANKGEGAGFYKWTGGLLGAGRVYLQKTVSGSAPQYISFSFGNDDTSGIVSMSDVKGVMSGAWYDLQGRRVGSAEANAPNSTLNSKLKKGVYIVNGRKVVVK